MKGFRSALRTVIVAGSVTGFFSGWVLLAHTVVAKPNTPATPAAAASTDPSLPPLDLKALAPQGDVPSVAQAPSSSGQASAQALPSLPSVSAPSINLFPRMRTGGS